MKLLILSLFLALWLPSNSQPRNMQAKLVEVKIKAGKAYCKAISMEGDSVYLVIGYGGWGKVRGIEPGKWVSIRAYFTDQQKKWYCRRIKLNS